MTRFDCMVGSSAGQRAAVSQAAAPLFDPVGLWQGAQPAAADAQCTCRLGARERRLPLALTMRIARAMDSRADPHEDLLVRSVHRRRQILDLRRHAKSRFTRRWSAWRQRRDGGRSIPELFRESPVNAIWEGTGNMQCLDVLRAMRKTPEVIEVFFREVAKAQWRVHGAR